LMIAKFRNRYKLSPGVVAFPARVHDGAVERVLNYAQGIENTQPIFPNPDTCAELAAFRGTLVYADRPATLRKRGGQCHSRKTGTCNFSMTLWHRSPSWTKDPKVNPACQSSSTYPCCV